MSLDVRRTLLMKQPACREGWTDVDTPTLRMAALAVICNAWTAQGHIGNVAGG